MMDIVGRFIQILLLTCYAPNLLRFKSEMRPQRGDVDQESVPARPRGDRADARVLLGAPRRDQGATRSAAAFPPAFPLSGAAACALLNRLF